MMRQAFLPLSFSLLQTSTDTPLQRRVAKLWQRIEAH